MAHPDCQGCGMHPQHCVCLEPDESVNKQETPCGEIPAAFHSKRQWTHWKSVPASLSKKLKSPEGAFKEHNMIDIGSAFGGCRPPRTYPRTEEVPVSKSETPRSITPAHEFLESGLGHMKDRASTYDKPEGERSMGKTVDMFRALTGIEMSEEQGWKFMCCLKMVRSEQGDFRADNFEDLAAYSGLAGEAASKG